MLLLNSMDIIAKKLTIAGFKEYVEKFDFGSIPPDKIVLHHTAKPTLDQWKGLPSLYAIKNFHEGKGWSANPHIFIAPDGIWLSTPMDKIGIHAGDGNATWERAGKTYGGYRRPWGAKLKGYSIGIEVVGLYDSERWPDNVKNKTFATLKFLMKRLGLKNDDIKFHRDYSTKTCPGSAIKKDWIFRELERYDDNGLYKPEVSIKEPSKWAEEAWNWAKENHLCDTTDPQEKITAEFLITMLYNSRKIK